MARPITSNPQGSTERVRRYRRKKALLSDLQNIIQERGDNSQSLDLLQSVVDTLQQ